MTRRIHALFVLAAVLCAAPGAPAQRVPNPEAGTPVVSLRRVENGAGFQLLDASDGRIIFDGSVRRLFEFQDPEVLLRTDIRAQPTGVDLVITAANPTQDAHKLGSFILSSFMLGQQIRYRDFRNPGTANDADYLTYVGQAHVYPDAMYSPVWVMSNTRYAIGISLLYPVLEYQHEVRFGMGSPQGGNAADPARGWLLEMRITGQPNEATEGCINHSAALAPGETRTYVISIRISRNPNEWVRTLTPYRSYFRDTYGGVKYERDPRPVLPVVCAAAEELSPDNPNGYTLPGDRRPDAFGWRAWSSALVPLAEKWGRVMLLAPSGVYGEDPSLNPPYQFTSHWLDDPESATFDDPLSGLPAVARAGKLGLWWGSSTRVATVWNPTLNDVHAFDPVDAAHVTAAFRELDVAARAGATCIGLEGFSHSYCPAWELHAWLQVLKARYPQMKFVAEAAASDILHNEAPAYLDGFNTGEPSGPDDLYPVSTPHFLADFLNPGHEIWIGYEYQHQRDLGISVTPALVDADARRFASLGYVPVMFEEFEPGPETLAVESWRRTLPHNLQQPVLWNAVKVAAPVLSAKPVPPAPPPSAKPTPAAGPAPALPDNPPPRVIADRGPGTPAPVPSTRPDPKKAEAPADKGREPAATRPIGPAAPAPTEVALPTDRSIARSSPKPLKGTTSGRGKSTYTAPSKRGKGTSVRSSRSAAPTVPAGVSTDLLRQMINDAVKRAQEGIPSDE